MNAITIISSKLLRSVQYVIGKWLWLFLCACVEAVLSFMQDFCRAKTSQNPL